MPPKKKEKRNQTKEKKNKKLTLPLASRPAKGTNEEEFSLLGKRTLPYDFEPSVLNEEETPSLKQFLGSFEQEMSPSQTELSPVDEQSLPEPIPESWEWEAIHLNERWEKKNSFSLWLWLVLVWVGISLCRMIYHFILSII